ncbi:MAG: ribosomal-processing cysteine protease Prp [Lachnospiraceae bacterium]|nr:ribosomal-processing cysteine protease Prp [Lachnospiraceae bacterium]
MIEARIRKQDGSVRSVRVKGHAEFEDAGKDIVCAAVSMLVINTANALERLTDNAVFGEELSDGLVFEFREPPDEKGVLLLDTMLLGLADVQEKYGKDYLKLIIEEV